MIDFFCDPVNRRVLIRNHIRVLGELAYQVEAPGDWLNPLAVESDDQLVRVTLGRPGGREVVIEDRFVLEDTNVTIARTWFLPRAGSYRLLFDYRSQDRDVGSAVLPGATYESFRDRSPAPAFSAPCGMLSFPGAAFETSDRVFGFLAEVEQSIGFDASIHLYESEKMAAVQARLPGTNTIASSLLGEASEPAKTDVGEEWITSRHVASRTVHATFTLVLDCQSTGEALQRLNEVVWSKDSHRFAEPTLSLSDYRQEKLRHVNRHVASDQSNQACWIRPAADEKRARPPRVISALAPYWGLLAARVFIQEGRRTAGSAYLAEGSELVAKLVEGRRANGLFCDVYDVTEEKWGSYLQDAFVPGHVSIRATATVARHLAEIYAELRGARIDRPELLRMASDAASVLIESAGAKSLWWEDGRCDLATASVISLLVRLESIRGRNSLRRTAVKRATGPFIEALSDTDTLTLAASNRDDLTMVTRAAIDVGYYMRDRDTLRAANEVTSTLASWVFAHDRVFPPRSRSQHLGVHTRGLVGCATDRRHLCFDGLPVAYELARASRLTGNETFSRIARDMCTANRQCLGGYTRLRNLPEGAQPAELDIMEWSSRRRDAKATGSLVGTRIAQSIEAAFASTLLLEHYPDIANFSSSAS